MTELEKLKVHICEMAKIIEGLKHEHLDEYIDDQLKEVAKCFKLRQAPRLGHGIIEDVQKVRSLLLEIYKAGSLSKS